MKYFAYGSNISEKRMIKERKIFFKSREFAYLPNYKLVFNKMSKKNNKVGFANIEECENSIVEGALYEISLNDFNIIDKYEGYPKHYYKKVINVICKNQITQAITYIANPNMIRETIKPNENYLNYILEGKDIFTKDYYEKLKLTETLK
jgi:gamma-glutamylcyclotransferase